MQPIPNYNLAPQSESQCSQSKCKAVLPVGYHYKNCEKCRSISKLSMQKSRKRKREEADGGPRPAPATGPEHTSDTEPARSESNKNVPIKFKDKNALMERLKYVFKTSERIFFHGCYDLPTDPLNSHSAHAKVKATAHEIWQVTGYRFRVKENLSLKNGHKSRYWCCQDEDRKQVARPSQKEGVKHRNTVGMDRYNCKSKLNISCRAKPREEDTCLVTIWLEHHIRHTPYHDVSLPPDTATMTRDSRKPTLQSFAGRSNRGSIA